MRKLATIRKINDIRPIPGADKIEVAQVDGWECVISKSDGFNVGDKIIYIEIDSIVPDKPEFEFLRSRKFRVRTIKLKGQVSQGLVVPISILPIKYISNHVCEVGDDVTEELGIKKYDPQAEQEQKLLGNVASNKTKILNIFQYCIDWLLSNKNCYLAKKVLYFCYTHQIRTCFF